MRYLAALAALLLVSTAFASDGPAITLHQALDLAEANMKERDLGKVIYVESVTLVRPAIFGGETYWFIKWSHPIPATDPNKHEIGIKVRMDGRTTRLVKGLREP